MESCYQRVGQTHWKKSPDTGRDLVANRSRLIMIGLFCTQFLSWNVRDAGTSEKCCSLLLLSHDASLPPHDSRKLEKKYPRAPVYDVYDRSIAFSRARLASVYDVLEPHAPADNLPEYHHASSPVQLFFYCLLLPFCNPKFQLPFSHPHPYYHHAPFLFFLRLILQPHPPRPGTPPALTLFLSWSFSSAKDRLLTGLLGDAFKHQKHIVLGQKENHDMIIGLFFLWGGTAWTPGEAPPRSKGDRKNRCGEFGSSRAAGPVVVAYMIHQGRVFY